MSPSIATQTKTVRAVVALAESRGRKAACFQTDLADEAAAVGLVRDAVGFLGGLDVWVNNSRGLVAGKAIGELDLGFW